MVHSLPRFSFLFYICGLDMSIFNFYFNFLSGSYNSCIIDFIIDVKQVGLVPFCLCDVHTFYKQKKKDRNLGVFVLKSIINIVTMNLLTLTLTNFGVLVK